MSNSDVIVFVFIFWVVVLVCALTYFYLQLKHKEIMAAIDKGVPLSGLRPPKPVGPAGIKSLTGGIALLIISLPLLFESFQSFFQGGSISTRTLFIGGLFFGLGTASFVRGLLLRKYQKEHNSDNSKDNNCGKP